MGDSLQVGPPQGEEEVSEKDIEALFVIDEEEIETLSGKDKAPFEVTKQKRDVEEQRGNTVVMVRELTQGDLQRLPRRLKRRG